MARSLGNYTYECVWIVHCRKLCKSRDWNGCQLNEAFRISNRPDKKLSTLCSSQNPRNQKWRE